MNAEVLVEVNDQVLDELKALRRAVTLVQYQQHAMNRWTFRKIDGQWYIDENIQRRMDSPDSGTLFEDF